MAKAPKVVFFCFVFFEGGQGERISNTAEKVCRGKEGGRKPQSAGRESGGSESERERATEAAMCAGATVKSA